MSAQPNEKDTGEANYRDVKNGLSEPKRILKALSIDCSVNHVGFATLQIMVEPNEEGTEMEKNLYWKWGMWELNGENLLDRCLDLCMYVQQSENADFDYLIIEWPMFYESTKGQIAAQESYTINLAAVGAYLAGFFHTPTDRVTLITAPDWKGNTSKDVTARRFFRTFGENHLQIDHNAVDAVMMLYAHALKQGWQNAL